MKYKHLSFALGIFLLVFACERSVYAQKIYLLVTGDTKDQKIGNADAVDIANISITFHAQVPERQLEQYGFDANRSYWNGPSIEEANDMKLAILDAIDRCPAGPNDTIVFYWSGHGMYDSGGHYIVMPSRTHLYRSEIVAAIQRRSPRLAVVISDSCNTFVNSSRLGQLPPCAVPQFAETISPLFDQLFLRHKGLVDINAASEGEEASCFAVPGGLFTAALSFYEERLNPQGRPTGRNIAIEVQPSWGNSYTASVPFGFFWLYSRERKSWNDLITHVNQTMRTRWRENTKQTIRVWSLPSPLPVPPWPPFPPVLSLTRNDVILSINGTQIGNEAECRSQIKNSGRIMEFTVRDSRDGTIWKMRTGLRNTSPRFGAYIDDAIGGGAIVTSVIFASPATFNNVLERVVPGVIPPALGITRNDVILSINGTPVRNEAECSNKIENSGAIMELTVRDSRDGTIWRMQTNLRQSSPRFGVYLDDASGGGAVVIGVVDDSPATHNHVLERVSANP
jgi:hypothetical protein